MCVCVWVEFRKWNTNVTSVLRSCCCKCLQFVGQYTEWCERQRSKDNVSEWTKASIEYTKCRIVAILMKSPLCSFKWTKAKQIGAIFVIRLCVFIHIYVCVSVYVSLGCATQCKSQTISGTICCNFHNALVFLETFSEPKNFFCCTKSLGKKQKTGESEWKWDGETEKESLCCNQN